MGLVRLASMTLLGAALVAPLAAGTPPPLCSAAGADLTHHWAGEGTAEDGVGAADGTVSGAGYVAGRIGSAFNFDGVDDQISFGSSVGNFGTDDFTVTYWIRTTGTAHAGVFGKRPSCFHDSFLDNRMTADGRLGVEIDQDPAATNYNSLATTATVNDGGFHFFAFVREGNTLRTWVDGVADTSGATTGVTNISNASNLIAGRGACTGVDGTAYFSGQLDEIKIYDRALSLCEVLAGVDAGLDFDLDGAVLPLTDMLLLLRRLFGFSGSVLTTGVVGNGCVRCGAEPLVVFIDAVKSALDVDGGGTVEPLTDGILFLRYAFGFRGTALIAGAVGQPCTRCDAPAVEGFLDPLFP